MNNNQPFNISLALAAPEGTSEISSVPNGQTSGISALGVNSTSLIFQIINFVILFIVLKKFVFKPIIQAVEQRRKMIEDSINNAKLIEEQKSAWNAQHKEMLEDALNKSSSIIEEARKQADMLKSEALLKTKLEQDKMLSQAKDEIRIFQQDSFDKAKKDIVSLVLQATEKITRKTLSPKNDVDLINKIIEENR